MDAGWWLSRYWLDTGLCAHFPELVTVQTPTQIVGDHGDVSESFADLPGHVNVPAMVVPVQAPGERHGLGFTVTVNTFQVALHGYYPAVLETHRALWNDRAYDIIGVFHAPGQAFTMLTITRAT